MTSFYDNNRCEVQETLTLLCPVLFQGVDLKGTQFCSISELVYGVQEGLI